MMIPTNDFAALMERFEKAVQSVSNSDGQYAPALSDLKDARAALLAYGAGVERDAERLDWLEKQVDPLHLEQDWKGGEYTMQKSATLYLFNGDYKGSTIREAIDAAITATRPTEARDAAIVRGLADAAAGRVTEPESFAQYVDEEARDDG